MRGLEVGNFSVALGLYPAEISGNQALGEMNCNHPNLTYRAFVGNWETVNEQVLSRTVDIEFVAIEGAENDERLTVEPVSQHEMAMYCRKGHSIPPVANTLPHPIGKSRYPFLAYRQS
jgi:DNA-binding transcriptional LysR family regulator